MRWKVVILAIILAVLGQDAALAATAVGAKVTVTQRAPMQTLDETGQPTGVGMSAPGKVYTLVKVDGDQLVLKADNGAQYQIASAATDYVAPAAVPATNTAATPSVPAPAPAPASSPAPTPAPTGDADAAMIKKIDDAFGRPLLADAHLFEDPLPELAKRLNCRPEGDSDNDGFRLYNDPATIFGCKDYSLSAAGKDGRTGRISIVFTNRTDFRSRYFMAKARTRGNLNRGLEDVTISPDVPTNTATDEQAVMNVQFAAEVDKETKGIEAKLNSLFGAGAPMTFGPEKDRDLLRWNWKDISFLFSNHNGNYVSLQIVPSAVADHPDALAAASRNDLSQELLRHVQNKQNGDVLITDIPNATPSSNRDCDGATWERYLSYLGIPADRYTLLEDGAPGAAARYLEPSDLMTDYLCRVKWLDGISVNLIAAYIDQGMPVMWNAFITKTPQQVIDKHSEKHEEQDDWHDYIAQVTADDKTVGVYSGSESYVFRGSAHLIIGYNRTTNQLAFLDSYPNPAKVRWVSEEELRAITDGQIRVEYIDW
jgi:hypothetical protein